MRLKPHTRPNKLGVTFNIRPRKKVNDTCRNITVKKLIDQVIEALMTHHLITRVAILSWESYCLVRFVAAWKTNQENYKSRSKMGGLVHQPENGTLILVERGRLALCSLLG